MLIAQFSIKIIRILFKSGLESFQANVEQWEN
jgi:hypothetical protein